MGKIADHYVGFFIINVGNIYPNILVVRVFFINPGMGGDVIPNVTSYTPNSSTVGLLVPD